MARKGENIRKRKDGRWEGRYLIPPKKGEAKKYGYVYGKSYSEVRDKKHAIQSKIQIGINLQHFGKNGHCYTLSELSQEWITSIQCHVKASTISSYQNILHRYILPEFEETYVLELTNQRLLEFIQNKYDEGFSQSTLHLITVVFREILSFGEKKNVAFLEPLELFCPKKFEEKKKIMEDKDYQKLCDYLLSPNTHSEAGFLLCLCSGIRLGELAGLTWENIDLENGIIRITRTISRINNPCYKTDGMQPKTLLYVRTPKTHSSRRTIPIPDILCEVLQPWKKNNRCYLMTGLPYCMEPRTIQRKFEKILSSLDIPHIKIHALRHHFSTMWIENSFDYKALSEILGHSSIRTTMDIYVHGNDRRKKEYVNQLGILDINSRLPLS